MTHRRRASRMRPCVMGTPSQRGAPACRAAAPRRSRRGSAHARRGRRRRAPPGGAASRARRTRRTRLDETRTPLRAPPARGGGTQTGSAAAALLLPRKRRPGAHPECCTVPACAGSHARRAQTALGWAQPRRSAAGTAACCTSHRAPRCAAPRCARRSADTAPARACVQAGVSTRADADHGFCSELRRTVRKGHARRCASASAARTTAGHADGADADVASTRPHDTRASGQPAVTRRGPCTGQPACCWAAHA